MKTVLVVEDDFDTQHPLAEILRLKGYSVFTASAVDRALAIARAKKPDLLITDIMLPGKSGLHLIRSVRSDRLIKTIPILVISGCKSSTLVEAKAAGADCCLEKPIRFDRFWATMERLVGRQRSEAGLDAPGADAGQGATTQIDNLIEQLRECGSKEGKEKLVRLLKDHLLDRVHKSGHA